MHLFVKIKDLIWWYLLINLRVSWIINTGKSDWFFYVTIFLWVDFSFWMKIINLFINGKVPFNDVLFWSFTKHKLCFELIFFFTNLAMIFFIILRMMLNLVTYGMKFFWVFLWKNLSDMFWCRDFTCLLFAFVRYGFTIFLWRALFCWIFKILIVNFFNAGNFLNFHFILSCLL